MAQGEKRNVSGFDVGTGHGSFFIRVNNQNYHNMFPDEVQIRTSSGFCSINPENPRAMQNLFGDEVLAMRFDSYEAGKSFYHKYASAVGFTVREDDMGKYKLGGEVVMKRWICNGEGFQQNIGDPSSSTRVKCPAAFCIHADSVSHKWLVIEFVAKHTHDLAPTCKHLQVAVADNLERKDAEYYIVGTAVKLPTSCERISITDVESALDYLCYKKNGDSGLFYETKFVEGRLSSLFWADSVSQLDNACFGEAMAVYRTNSYMMPLVILAGLNHHHQTCVFGCALLHEETVEAYTWLFQTFLHVMQGCMPLSVVTDGHKAVHKAIKHVLPRSRQPLCTWHLENEAHSIVNKRSFVSDFKVCMMEVLSQEDFELKWKAMVEKYKLSENPWIHRMYKKRHMWAETYLRGHFWGGLQSTRVCERINEHLSRFSHNKMRIFQFIQLCDEAIFPIRFSEAKAEYESIHIKFSVSTSLVKIEKHAADVFTRESYERFLLEMQLESLLFILNKDDGSNHRTYRLGNYENQNSAYEVMFKPSGPSIKCSCLKFETLGLPCSHIIHVIKSERLEKIPQNLIHLRWTKTAKSSAQYWQRSLPPVSSDLMEKLMRYGALTSNFSILSYLASKSSEQTYNFVCNSLCELRNELNECSIACSERDGGSVSRIARSKGNQKCGRKKTNGDKRRKTNGDGHSRNV